VDRVSASAVAREASFVRRAETSTTRLTMAATATKTTSERMLFVSAMLKS